MNIRLLSISDLDALLALYAHLHDVDAPLPDRVVVEATWLQLATDARYRYFGGFVDDRLICCCNLTIIPNLTRGCRPFGIMENVVTHAAFRRRGCGHSIVRHALSDAWASNCYKVMLQTGRLDDGTFRFYEDVGFERHGKQAFIARAPV